MQSFSTHLTVLDDVLSDNCFLKLRAAALQTPVAVPQGENAAGLVWRSGDSPPLVGGGQSIGAEGNGAAPGFEDLSEFLSGHTVIFGRVRMQIDTFSMRVHAMTIGNSLGCHFDGNNICLLYTSPSPRDRG